MKKPKPYIGQILYSLNVGNDSRYRKQELTEVVVVSVGRKYFSCKTKGFAWGTKYYLEDWRQVTKYSPTSILYENPKTWHEQKESYEIRARLKDILTYKYHDLSFDQLKAINSIIDNRNMK